MGLGLDLPLAHPPIHAPIPNTMVARVEKVVKLFGIVNSHSDFKEQHLVMNGCVRLPATPITRHLALPRHPPPITPPHTTPSRPPTRAPGLRAPDLICEVFPDLPKHARSAIGTNTLPLGVATEVEAIVRIRRD